MDDVLESLIGSLIGLYNSEEPKVVENAIEILQIIIKKLDADMLLELITPLKRAVNVFYIKSIYSKSGNNDITVLNGLTYPKVNK